MQKTPYPTDVNGISQDALEAYRNSPAGRSAAKCFERDEIKQELSQLETVERNKGALLAGEQDRHAQDVAASQQKIDTALAEHKAARAAVEATKRRLKAITKEIADLDAQT
jgi:hypothetical protein